jgi:anti-sigma-K factor RskA
VVEQHVEELIPAYALGILDEAEAQQVARHLHHCDLCQRELEAYEAVAVELAQAVPEVAPPAELEARLLERVTQEKTRPAAAPASPWRESLAALKAAVAGRAWRPLLVLALILLVVTGSLALWQRLYRPETDFHTVRLAGAEAAPEANAIIVISSDGLHGTLVAENLPALPETQQYQLWLIADGERTDGGVFSVREHGYTNHYINAPRPLSEYQAFGVTIEPEGGSPGPTGARALASMP